VSVTGQIYIYGEVGKQVTLDTVLKEISDKNSDYFVHIHSIGGDVFEGYAIYNALKNTGKKITVYIEGVCASIATLIASAGDKIIMNTKSQFMIHNPRIGNMSGDSKDLRNVAGQLDRIKSQLIQSWVGRTSLTFEQLSEMYDNETWLTPEQAKEMGFVDEVQEVLKAVASADLKKFKIMEDRTTIFNKLEGMIKRLFNQAPEIKNATETLKIGEVIIVPDGDDWVGQTVTLETGEPLPAGEYELESGKIIVVDETGVVTEKREIEVETTPDDSMENKKLEAAEARIKELESALEAQKNAVAQAEAKARTFENKLNTDLKAVQDELNKIKTTTVGDTTPPDKGFKNQFIPDQKQPVTDSMQAFFGQIIKERQ
jgi:ATP-dependent protease ClpP protease subunit